MLKLKIDEDRARKVLAILESEDFMLAVESWIVEERNRLFESSSRRYSSGEAAALNDIGVASGLQRCLDRIISLRNLCKTVLKQEVDNLKQGRAGGPTSAKV